MVNPPTPDAHPARRGAEPKRDTAAEDRMAAALRANLRRRKDAARANGADSRKVSAPPKAVDA